MNEISTSSTVHEMNTVMNRIAEHLLQDKVSISYTRFIFLFIVKQYDAPTQHHIAQAMKISDPAISKVCREVVHEGLIRTAINPRHKRQRLIYLTTTGERTLQRSLAVLNACFSDVCAQAGIDEEVYREQTTHLLDSLNNKYKEIAQ